MKQALFIIFLCSSYYNNLICNNGDCKYHSTKNNSSKEQKSVPTHHFDLLNTELTLKPIFDKKQIQGKAILTLKPYFYNQNQLTLDARQMNILNVKEIVKHKSNVLNFVYDSSKLTINFDRAITKKDTISIEINYIANPELVSENKGSAIYSDKGAYFINVDKTRKNIPTQFWTQGETHGNSAWFPTIDHPSEKHTQKISVTFDNHFVSLANGTKTKSIDNKNGTTTDIWEQKIPHSVYLTALIIGDFKIIKDKWKNKEVSYYMEPKYEEMARPIFGRTVEMIEFFSTLLNYPFPWDKYSQVLVHDFVSGAMENTTAVTFNSSIFQLDKRDLVDKNDDETVAHELFHHWFGDLVTCEDWTHLTLNESFANYSEYLWDEHKLGLDEAQHHWYEDMNAYFMSPHKKESLIRYDYDNPDDMFDVISYHKGGKILHMLRKYIGDEAFFASLSNYLKKHQYTTAEYSNLRQSFEEITGTDLNWFFNQWYLKGGHPIINVNSTIKNNSCSMSISQKHSFDSNFVYTLLPIKISFYTTNGVKDTFFDLTKSVDTFVVNLSDSIISYNFNADKSLVAKINDNKNTSQWVYNFLNTPNYLDKKEALLKIKSKSDNKQVYDALVKGISFNNKRISASSIGSFSAKEIQNDKILQNLLFENASNCSNSLVRYASLSQLNKSDLLKDKKDLILKSLTDSSYLVEAIAIESYSKIDSLKALEYALKASSTSNYSLKASCLKLISTTNDPKYFYVFEDGIENSIGYDKIVVAQYLGSYASVLNDNDFAKTVSYISSFSLGKDQVDKICFSSCFNSLKQILNKNKDVVSQKRYDEIISKFGNIKFNEHGEDED